MSQYDIKKSPLQMTEIPSASANFFFLFQLNAHNKLNTYIYHLLPPTCFSVCYSIFREAIALFAQELYASCKPHVLAIILNSLYSQANQNVIPCHLHMQVPAVRRLI